LFDFDGDLYGSCVKVVFCSKLRNEKKFDGLEELKQAIAADVTQAKLFFAERNKRSAV
jgi:riboflavin kinase/FMN adenylyltransferase